MSPPQKLVMARALDELGVDIIETGFPASSQSDREAMALIGRELRRPSLSLAVLSRCLQADIETSARALEAAANPRLHVFLSTSPLHREHKLRMTREQVLESVRKHVSLARSYIDDVEFSAEDATRTELDYLIEVSRVAIAAGATTINLPDTVGFTTPEEIRAMFQQVIAGVADVPNAANVIFSAHCHNDLGLAVANSLAAIEGGARQVECTINGIGERAGNCSLEEIAMVLKVRQAFYEQDSSINTRASSAPRSCCSGWSACRCSATRPSSAPTPSPTSRASTSTACCATAAPTKSCARKTWAGKIRRWCWAATVAAPPSKRACVRWASGWTKTN
jgi:2-isopropylmalate synthase